MTTSRRMSCLPESEYWWTDIMSVFMVPAAFINVEGPLPDCETQVPAFKNRYPNYTQHLLNVQKMGQALIFFLSLLLLLLLLLI